MTNPLTVHVKEWIESEDSLKEENPKFINQLKFLRAVRGIDISVIPQDVADCLSLDHLA